MLYGVKMPRGANIQRLCTVLVLCWMAIACQQLEHAVTEREVLSERRGLAIAYEQQLQPVRALQSIWNDAAASLRGTKTVETVTKLVRDSVIPALAAYEEALTAVSVESSTLQDIHDDLSSAHRDLLKAYTVFVSGLTRENYARRSDVLRIDYERFRSAQATYRRRLSQVYSNWGIQLRSTGITSPVP